MSDAISRRYAKALFELAKEKNALDKVSKTLDELQNDLNASDALRGFIASPLYSREDQLNVVSAYAKKAKLETLVANTLGVMAKNRRLSLIPGLITSFRDLMSAENDEVVVDVTSAKALSAAQSKKLAAVLKTKLGKDVTINETIDPEILGGLVINIGSTMIDNSLKGKLSKLHNAMKEVG